MRIAIVGPASHPIVGVHHGGLERHTIELFNGLKRLGHTVHLIDVRIPAALSADGGRWDDFGIKCRHPDTFVHHYWRSASTIPCLTCVVELITGLGVDVVQDNSAMPDSLACYGHLDSPVVLTLHTPRYRRMRLAIDEFGQSATLVAVSEYCRDAWGLRRALVVNNGIASAFTESPLVAREGRNVHAFWHGRIVPEKGAHHAVLAAKEADCDLLMAGPVHDSRYWNDYVLPLLDGRRRWVGHLDSADLVKALGVSRLSISTSLTDEMFGYAPIEGLAAGAALVAYGSGAISGLQRVGNIVRRGDIEALTQAIRQGPMAEPDACRAVALEFPTVETMVRRYESVYRSLL